MEVENLRWQSKLCKYLEVSHIDRIVKQNDTKGHLWKLRDTYSQL